MTFYAVIQLLLDHSSIVVQFYGKNTNLPIPVFADARQLSLAVQARETLLNLEMSKFCHTKPGSAI